MSNSSERDVKYLGEAIEFRVWGSGFMGLEFGVYALESRVWEGLGVDGTREFS